MTTVLAAVGGVLLFLLKVLGILLLVVLALMVLLLLIPFCADVSWEQDTLTVKAGALGITFPVFRYTAPEKPELVWYSFRFTRPDGSCVYLGRNGLGEQTSRQPWQLTVYEPSPAPDWFGRGVTYQIFPDRFRRVSMPDVSHMPGHRWLHRGWNEQPVSLPDEHGQITNRDFFGG